MLVILECSCILYDYKTSTVTKWLRYDDDDEPMTMGTIN